MKSPPLLLLAPALLLSACGDDPAPDPPATGNDDRTAGGDVRGGEISDAMLPLDTVRSQSPSMALEGGDAGDGSGTPGADPAIDDASNAESADDADESSAADAVEPAE